MRSERLITRQLHTHAAPIPCSLQRAAVSQPIWPTGFCLYRNRHLVRGRQECTMMNSMAAQEIACPGSSQLDMMSCWARFAANLQQWKSLMCTGRAKHRPGLLVDLLAVLSLQGCCCILSVCIPTSDCQIHGTWLLTGPLGEAHP